MSMVVLQVTNLTGLRGFIPLSSVQVAHERTEGGCEIVFTDSTLVTVKESLDDLLRQIPDPNP